MVSPWAGPPWASSRPRQATQNRSRCKNCSCLPGRTNRDSKSARWAKDIGVVAATEQSILVAKEIIGPGNRLPAGRVGYFQHEVVLLIVDQFELARKLLGPVAEEAANGPLVGVQHLDIRDAGVGTDDKLQTNPLAARVQAQLFTIIELVACHCEMTGPWLTYRSGESVPQPLPARVFNMP